MSQTTEAPPAPSTLDRAVAALREDDSNLDNVAAVLRALGTADYSDVADTLPSAFGRMSGLCWFLAKQLTERFDAETRCAPPLALRDVVAESLRPCPAPSCDQMRAPWQSEVCEDATCVREVAEAFGAEPEPFDMSGATPGVER